MGGIPASRITQFVLGNKKANFPIKITLIANERCQIRHNALESARITVNRALEKNIGTTNYRVKIMVYPHVVLRENKQATGAGADRVSQGMRAAYGKIVSTAAELKQNQVIMSVETNKQYISAAKDALRKAGMKMPTPCSTTIEKNT
jgi:large subunit ribosomal protein L10e